MEYYTKELWMDMNSLDTEKRNTAREKWRDHSILYAKKLESIKAFLPIEFLLTYQKNNGFHDFKILSISILLMEHVVKIHLSDGNEKGIVELHEVSGFLVDCCNLGNCICGRLTWGYSEFDVDTSGMISISILCDIENELYFKFGSISYKKQ